MDRHLFKEKPVAELVDFFFVETNDQSADDIRDKSSSIRVFFSSSWASVYAPTCERVFRGSFYFLMMSNFL